MGVSTGKVAGVPTLVEEVDGGLQRVVAEGEVDVHHHPGDVVLGGEGGAAGDGGRDGCNNTRFTVDQQ